MYCLNCDKQVREASKFCYSCGAPVGEKLEVGATTELNTFTTSSKIEPKQWLLLKDMIIFYACFLALITFSGWIGRVSQNPVFELLTWILMASLTIFFSWKYRKDAFPYLKLYKLNSKTLVHITVVSITCYIVITSYFLVFDLLKTQTVQYFDDFADYGWPIWSGFVLVSFFPGFFEELAFRGVIQTNFEKIMSVNEALVIQAALFSILHLNPVIFISHFIMGLFLGWIRNKTNTIYFSVGLHMAWNASVLVKEIWS